MHVSVGIFAFDVEFTVEGKHIPATRYQPEEFPEIIITKLTTSEDLLELFEHEITLNDIVDQVIRELNEEPDAD